MAEFIAAFLSFNSKDRDDAKALVRALDERGVRVWLSDRELGPGTPFPSEIEKALQSVSAAVVLIGRSGIGEWQKTEVDACVNEAARRKMRLIPVLLPGGPDHAGLGPLLASYTVVDLRGGVDDEVRLRELVRGVRGMPEIQEALETTRILMAEAIGAEAESRSNEPLDAWAMAAVKSRLHAASEVYAQMASDNAAMASAVYPEDILNILIPLVVDLRWNRGYASGLERLLQIPQSTKKLFELDIEEASPPCSVHEGVLSAERRDESRVLICLAGEPAAVVSGLDATAADAVLEAVNGYGRLGVPSTAGLSLLERIGEVPLRGAAPDKVAAALYRNREALIPLVARLGLPGDEWLLTDDEDMPPGDLLLTDVPAGGEPPREPDWAGSEEVVIEEIYSASGTIRKATQGGISRSQLRNLLRSEAARTLFGDMIEKDPEGVLKLLT